MSEEWRDVPGYEGKFQVSSTGRVRTLRILRPHVKSTGYQEVGRSHRGTNILVHDLVARAFIGSRPEGCHINHKDGDKTNNRPTNLEYVTPKENNHHAFEVGLLRHGFTRRQMTRISYLYFERGLSVSQIARKLGRHRSSVRSVIEIWRAKDRKGRKNPFEFKLDDQKAFDLIRTYRSSGLSQVKVAAAFGVHASHVSRINSGKMHPQALAWYQEQYEDG